MEVENTEEADADAESDAESGILGEGSAEQLENEDTNAGDEDEESASSEEDIEESGEAGEVAMPWRRAMCVYRRGRYRHGCAKAMSLGWKGVSAVGVTEAKAEIKEAYRIIDDVRTCCRIVSMVLRGRKREKKRVEKRVREREMGVDRSKCYLPTHAWC